MLSCPLRSAHPANKLPVVGQGTDWGAEWAGGIHVRFLMALQLHRMASGSWLRHRQNWGNYLTSLALGFLMPDAAMETIAVMVERGGSLPQEAAHGGHCHHPQWTWGLGSHCSAAVPVTHPVRIWKPWSVQVFVISASPFHVHQALGCCPPVCLPSRTPSSLSKLYFFFQDPLRHRSQDGRRGVRPCWARPHRASWAQRTPASPGACQEAGSPYSLESTLGGIVSGDPWAHHAV